MNTPAKKTAHATAKRSNEIGDRLRFIVWTGKKHITLATLNDGSRARFSKECTAFVKAEAQKIGVSAAVWLVRHFIGKRLVHILARKQQTA